jgi:choline dehydrogenase-like flavoprotein
MILDARDDAVALNRAATIVIVGAGPSGMTLARELAGLTDVLLIEAGGFEVEDETLTLLEGECAGIGYPLTETRARQFGGSSDLWAGYCAVFDPHDFERRDWAPGSGWPFGRNEIAPFYEKAAACST